MTLVVDLITRIRNGYMADKSEITAQYSKLSENLLILLVREGFILSFKAFFQDNKKYIIINLKPKFEKKPVIRAIKAVSKPSRKIYAKCSDVARMKSKYSGMRISILSTNKGLMTDYEAVSAGIGGKVLCYVM